MNSIRIGSSRKRILVNDDPERVIEFDPSDVAFAERFYGLIRDFEAKRAEYERRAEEIDRERATDDNDLPVNLPERIAYLREVCEYMREQIDRVFGAGTSQAAFGDALSLEMIMDLFDGLTPFIQAARSEKLKKYSRPAKGKGRKVMR